MNNGSFFIGLTCGYNNLLNIYFISGINFVSYCFVNYKKIKLTIYYYVTIVRLLIMIFLAAKVLVKMVK